MILQGDVLNKLQEIKSDSIQCVVTSPPYWNLRDYQTAEWEGGDEDCQHMDNLRPRSERRKGKFHGGEEPS